MAAEESTNANKRDTRDAPRLCEERFTNLLELSAEWYWEQDENYRFILLIRTGFAAAEDDPLHFIGTARWDHYAVPVGDDGSLDKHKAEGK